MERRRSAAIFAALSICTLVALGCTRNSSTQEERAEPPPSSNASPGTQSAQDDRPVIVAFGDSLTAGVAGRSYPDDLQDLLDKSGYRYRIENQGISGDTTTDGLARLDNIISAHPALVIVEFGGNDGLRGVPVESIRSNLGQIIERLKQANLPLVLLGITLPPNYGLDYVRSFTTMYPDLAQRYHLRFVPFLLINVYQRQELMQPDGIHPNGEGNKIIAQDVFKLIQPLLQRP